MKMIPLLVGVAAAVGTGAAVGAVWLRRRFVLVTIQGGSMQPTFNTGDRVLVRRTPLSAIHQGAVVVVEQPIVFEQAIPESEQSIQELPPWGSAWEQDAGEGGRGGLDRDWMIKRAAAVPGSPLPKELAAALGETPGALVPPGHLAVLGDNADASYDSRICGYLTEAQVLGVAVRAVARTTQQSSPALPPPFRTVLRKS